MRLVSLNMLKLSSNLFTERSKAVPHLWTIFVFLFMSLLYCLVCSLLNCDHLLETVGQASDSMTALT